MKKPPSLGLLFCLALICSQVAFAVADGVTITFLPSPPVAGQAITAHLVGSGSFCLTDPANVTQNGNEIDATIWPSDACSAGNLSSTRDLSLGSFSAGQYVLVLQFCEDNPRPLPPSCQLVTSTPFNVLGAAGTATAPAISVYGMLALAFLLATTAALKRRSP